MDNPEEIPTEATEVIAPEPHVHDEHCDHDNKPEEASAKSNNILSEKEVRALVKSKYEEKQSTYSKAYLMMHKKTKKMVELKGSSALQACSHIGWRARHVKVLAEREILSEEKSNG